MKIGKARMEKSVLVIGWTSTAMTDEGKVRLRTRSVIISKIFAHLIFV